MFQDPDVRQISAAFESPDTPIAVRMSMLFWAKQLGGPSAVDILSKALTHDSVLFKHELAYVLGQIGEKSAADILVRLLEDSAQHDMVRHEAAEALAALNAVEHRAVLEKHAAALSAPIRETCQIALASIDMKQRKDSYEVLQKSDFNSVDPISGVAVEALTLPDVHRYSQQLADTRNSLPVRYEALFTLRNATRAAAPIDKRTDAPQAAAEAPPAADLPQAADVPQAAVAALCDCLHTDKSSALLRHEIAFVLGQVLSESSTVTLSRVLMDESEHPMARHEAAMALGAVLAHHCKALDAAEVESGTSLLKTYSAHGDQIVAESCVVALDTLAAASV